MKKILIYKGRGVSRLSLKSIVASFHEQGFHNHFILQAVDSSFLSQAEWEKETHLIVFPGGRDLPYLEKLQGQTNQRIKQFVENGGNYLGICAGAYYGSKYVDFDREGPLEVQGTRELNFFEGIAFGPIYRFGYFDYESESGACLAKINYNDQEIHVYFNGGCGFSENQLMNNTTVIARYADIDNLPPAIIFCKVGKGKALLSGIHFEYGALHAHLKDLLCFSALSPFEESRQNLTHDLFQLF